MNYLILINKQSKPVVIEVPEKPELKNFTSMSAYGSAVTDYEVALEDAIDDESKHIYFKDKIQVSTALSYEFKEVVLIHEHVGETFQIPEGWRLNFEYQIKSLLREDQWNTISERNYNDGINSKSARMFRKVALLEKTSERVENLAHSFTEGSEECISRYSGESMSPSKPTAVAEPVKEKRIDWPVEIFDYINPALHLLHNGKPVMPGSKEHQLLQTLWNHTD